MEVSQSGGRQGGGQGAQQVRSVCTEASLPIGGKQNRNRATLERIAPDHIDVRHGIDVLSLRGPLRGDGAAAHQPLLLPGEQHQTQAAAVGHVGLVDEASHL